ncbi:amidohydrolase family protein [Novipirellula artificiosorum]|uniref:Guanine deaminase n=1 Tax=Novipirellula artificiosorum TaxID=2528016 RepID=A0A5C6DC15_9BACT|nr:amidohydrolase family protein [Novipirellula artificiosorum]TWU33394.1 Guanine deaminase [Novipirellula artificiosorum]
MTILAGQLLLADDRRRTVVLESGFVRLQHGRIAEVVTGVVPSTADISNRHAIICPGFIDAHLHLPQFSMIGAHGMNLLDWLDRVTFPSEQKWEDPRFARQMTRSALSQCLSVGTTSFCAYASVHHLSTIESLRVADEMGFRGVIGQVLMDQNAPATLCREPNQLLDEASRTLERFPPSASMAAAVTPRFAISCSRELLAGAGALANGVGAIVQTHLAETKDECAQVSRLFDGQRYVDVYRDTNLLTPRTVLGHGIHLDDNDCRVLAEHQSRVAHCPVANTFLGSGTMNRHRLVQQGVDVILGSDIGAGYETSMARVARSMIEAASVIGKGVPTAAQALYDITAGAADALEWDDVGRIREDGRADLFVIEPNMPLDPFVEPHATINANPLVDPLSKLLFSWDDRWIKRTYLAGKQVYP